MTQSITIFQFNGCTKCFDEAVMLKDEKTFVSDPSSWSATNIDVAILTGYMLGKDQKVLETIKANAKKVITFGSCASTGGIFGLAHQKGNKLLQVSDIVSKNSLTKIDGCLGSYEELEAHVSEHEVTDFAKNLCAQCTRSSTGGYLDEINRQVEADEDTCFTDQGVVCSGVVSKGCKENCVSFLEPCRGCIPNIDRPGMRMIGMIGTQIANMEVATEATGKGGTDKLADEDDEISEAFIDTVGLFYRFNLANSILPLGRIPSSGNFVSDIFIGRQIEELPTILGRIGGSKFISLTLSAIEAYENASNTDVEVSESVKDARKSLLALESELSAAAESKNIDAYKSTTDKIRAIAGNMNLSKIYFGGTRNAPHEFDFEDGDFSGTYENGSVKYTLSENGLITEFALNGGL